MTKRQTYEKTNRQKQTDKKANRQKDKSKKRQTAKIMQTDKKNGVSDGVKDKEVYREASLQLLVILDLMVDHPCVRKALCATI